MTDWTNTASDVPRQATVSLATPADYLELLKPRVMSLVVFTALVGLVLGGSSVGASGLHPVAAAISLLAIAIGAGASGALNMWWDADIDAVMGRTAKRPVPSGRVSAGEALSFGIVLSVGSVFVLGLASNWLAAGLLAFTIFFYAVVYTMWLKRRTPQNIVIGGAAGAFPPMIGWVVMTGSVDLPSVALFMLIFAWTPPHFWALALVKCDDYARARVPMLPVVAGRAATRLQILVYSVLLMPVGLAPWWLGFASSVYGAIALAANLVFLLLAIRVWRITEETDGEAAARKAAMRLFLFSILYLFGLFATLLAEPVAQHLWRLA